MSQKTLVGSIALDRMISVKMTKKGKDGQPVEGIFIPIEKNKLEVNDYGIQLPVRVIYKEETDDKGQNGFISKSIGSTTFKNASEEQKAQWKNYDNEETKALTPILGNIKDFGASTQSTSEVAKAEPIDADEDDLPF